MLSNLFSRLLSKPNRVGVTGASRRRSRIEQSFLPVILTAIACLGGATYEYATPDHYSVRMRLASSVTSTAQLFYDSGSGYREADSVQTTVHGGMRLETIIFPLPAKQIRHLRFDPLMRSGRIILQEIVLVDPQGKVVRTVLFPDIRPLSQIEDLHVDAMGIMVNTIRDANDPALTLNLPEPLSPPRPDSLVRAVRTDTIIVLAFLLGTITRRLFRMRLDRVSGQFAVFLKTLESYPARLIIAFLFLVSIVFRAPYLFTDPRFWAEEGNIFFQRATTHTLFASAIYLYPDAGYFNMVANIGGVVSAAAAHIAGLEHAPLATVLLACAIQFGLISMILFGKSTLFDHAWKKVIACLLVLFAPPSVGETWLNTINSMSWMGLIGIVLLFEDTSEWSRLRRLTMGALLILAGLTGIYAALLAPLFFVAFVVSRQREKLIQGVILAGCLAIQVSAMVVIRSTVGLHSDRFTQMTVDAAPVLVLFFEVVTPVLGQAASSRVFDAFGQTRAFDVALSHSRVEHVYLAGTLAALTILAFLTILTVVRINWNKVLLVLTYCILAGATAIASLGGVPSGRYTFVPGLTLLFLVLANINADRRFDALPVICSAVLLIALWHGSSTYRDDPLLSGQHEVAPSWRAEVGLWRATPDYRMRTWPDWWHGRITYSPSRAVVPPVGPYSSPDVEKLPMLKGDTLQYVDSINDVSKLEGLVHLPACTSLTVVGWAVDSPNSLPAAAVWIDIDGKLYQARYGISRPDVANVFKVSSYVPSGFTAVVPTSDLSNRVHRLTLMVVNHDSSGYYIGRTFQFDTE